MIDANTYYLNKYLDEQEDNEIRFESMIKELYDLDEDYDFYEEEVNNIIDSYELEYTYEEWLKDK